MQLFLDYPRALVILEPSGQHLYCWANINQIARHAGKQAASLQVKVRHICQNDLADYQIGQWINSWVTMLTFWKSRVRSSGLAERSHRILKSVPSSAWYSTVTVKTIGIISLSCTRVHFCDKSEVETGKRTCVKPAYTLFMCVLHPGRSACLL